MTTITAQHADSLLEAPPQQPGPAGRAGSPLPGTHQAGDSSGPPLHRLPRGRLLPPGSGDVTTGPGTAQGPAPQHQEPGGRDSGWSTRGMSRPPR